MPYDYKPLIDVLKTYNFDDLQKTFFTLSVWLPNISSPVKLQFLYSVLESIHDDLPTEHKILNYADFVFLCEKIIELVPGFPTIEDYVPVPDWGEVSYFYGKEYYKIFDGSDLINTYDFHSAFEILHSMFIDEYRKVLKRDPVEELTFLLKGQDNIINGLMQDTDMDLSRVVPGYLEVPTEDFALDVFTFISDYDPASLLQKNILKQYTNDYSTKRDIPDVDDIANEAMNGTNCFYLYARKNDKTYPVLPRRHIAVVYDTWGQLLKSNDVLIRGELKRLSLEDIINMKIYDFISKRVDEDHVLEFASAVKDTEGRPPVGAVYTAIQTKGKLVLIGVTAPVFDDTSFKASLDALVGQMKLSVPELSRVPCELGLLSKRSIVQFQPGERNSDKAMEMVFIAATPVLATDLIARVQLPDDLNLHVISLDQLAGIFDEIESLDQLSGFLDHLNEENRIFGANSLLDRLGAYKSSSGVLVAGALEPNQIMLDFSMGSYARHDSLKDFWSKYPKRMSFGHPMSWKINDKRTTQDGLVLEAKSFFGYVFYQKLKESSFVINAPVHMMDLPTGNIVDPVMHSLYDAIDQCKYSIAKLDYVNYDNKVQIFIAPDSLVRTEEDLSHVRHLLLDGSKLWEIDAVRIRANDFGVRVVFKRDLMVDALSKVVDRSLQLDLLIDVLRALNNRLPSSNIDAVINEIQQEKTKPPRFKSFKIEKTVSFPECVKEVLPDDRDYKLADKKIAYIAASEKVEPGKYDSDDAKQVLTKLRDSVVNLIDEVVNTYDLKTSLPFLLEKSDALINKYEIGAKHVEIALEHEVDYERDVTMGDDFKKFLHWHRVYKYAIEKFVQHKPQGALVLREDSLQELLALIDRLMDIYSASDFIHYQMYPASVEIDRDFLASLQYGTDVQGKEKSYGEEQAKLKLGLIGNAGDSVDGTLGVFAYLESIDSAFKKDLGFGIKNMVNVLMVLSRWSMLTADPEHTSYSATFDEINEACKKSITGYDDYETQRVLDFLELKTEEVLIVQDKDGKDVLCKDVPIWEHFKRRFRYSIRPIVKISNTFVWSPYGTERAGKVWLGVSGKHKLPADLDAPTIKSVLETGHKDVEDQLVKKIEEVCLRFTTSVKPSVYPHKLDVSTPDIGDVDVFAYIPETNTILNIESKIIDPPFCNKDAGRMQRMVFLGEGALGRSYTDKVLDRERYLKANGLQLGKDLGLIDKSVTEIPTVKSLFVTKMGYWWTKNPPIETGIDFVEIQLLEDYLKAYLLTPESASA